MALKLEVKYFDKSLPEIKRIKKGDWIDLYSRTDVCIKKGEKAKIPLNVAMRVPEGYEIHAMPRSSTFDRYHIIQTNGTGIYDNLFCGDNDEYQMPVYAMEDTKIPKGTRICQFRIFENMPDTDIVTVEHLNSTDRGGFGSTGI